MFCWLVACFFYCSSSPFIYRLKIQLNSMCVCASHSVVSNSLQSHGLWPTSFPCPWDPSGKTTKVYCHFLLQRLFPTQRLNLGLLHCRQILYHFSHQGSPPTSLKCFKSTFKFCQIKVNMLRIHVKSSWFDVLETSILTHKFHWYDAAKMGGFPFCLLDLINFYNEPKVSG